MIENQCWWKVITIPSGTAQTCRHIRCHQQLSHMRTSPFLLTLMPTHGHTLTQTYVQAHCVQRHIKDNPPHCSLLPAERRSGGNVFKQRGIEIEEVKESVSEKERTHKGILRESPLEKEKHKRLGIADRFHFSPLLLAACSLRALRAKGFADKHLTRWKEPGLRYTAAGPSKVKGEAISLPTTLAVKWA